MATVRQLLQGKGSEVASIEPDKSVYDAMQLMAARISAHCWCWRMENWPVSSLKEIIRVRRTCWIDPRKIFR